MDRNAPCPCGSGRKYKKCHGAAVPPEAAALAPEARAEWLRGDMLLQRQKRIGQELLDWAERKMGAEWIDAALDAWGVGEHDDVNEAVADLFTAWSLFNYRPPTLAKSIAAAWLDDAAGRKADDDARQLVSASQSLPLGIWGVETVEAGVGMTLTDRLSETTCFVHEPDLTHDMGPGEFLLAYVVEADGVRVFAGIHADPLLVMDAKPLLTSVLEEAGASGAPMPRERQVDATWQIGVARLWTETADAAYAEQEEQSTDDPPS